MVAKLARDVMTADPACCTADATLDQVAKTMEKHQIRRVPVVDERGCCSGIIAQADVASRGGDRQVAELVREVSR
jgi:CBS domain-containing protein